MACQRNRILDKLTEYYQSLGIQVNIGKNSARGNKGIFIHNNKNFRIDISKNMDNDEMLSVLLHEFAHYIHYQNDNSLKSLDFAFEDYNSDLHEELINITVQSVPKDFASKLYDKKKLISSEIKNIFFELKNIIPNIKMTENYKKIEKSISAPQKYLLKFDRIKYMNEIYSVEDIDSCDQLDDIQKKYIKLKFKQRCLNRLNSRITRLNKYYNNSSELFARFIELYYTNPDKTKIIAPLACKNLKISYIEPLNQLRTIFDNTKL